ncbi:hypothetical protein [Paraburkholderia azotifigens]|uniref:Uncharacterized protein n=1 Tax=Paraburkholderia azotifigens TaxID=2057004 RepID=A0A5C6V5X9_9BURK|nr:hypothetical protein [Paraburkholderia azotifigens]TXC80537.1 hypothetical protein FRZ40_40460 [Paraburkholderia azotifigens]
MVTFFFRRTFARLGLIGLTGLIGLIGLLACMIVGCSASAPPQTASRAETPSCSAPGHFCETFFGP